MLTLRRKVFACLTTMTLVLLMIHLTLQLPSAENLRTVFGERIYAGNSVGTLIVSTATTQRYATSRQINHALTLMWTTMNISPNHQSKSEAIASKSPHPIARDKILVVSKMKSDDMGWMNGSFPG